MRKTLTFFIVLGCALSLSAQVKSYVGVVSGKKTPEFNSTMRANASSLTNDGYDDLGEYIDLYLDGTFGSGFVFVDKDNTNYIITNKHVIEQATEASITFENEDGSKTTFDNLELVAVDDDIDLALFKFKDNSQPFKKGLPISNKTLKDGDEVWTAGFPGLAGKPMWQLGKGNVTNSKAYIDELLDSSISSIIQHSAEIDGGNSGGPLLISSNTDIGFEVVGVNAWKAFYRQNTNFSIPAKVIVDFIEQSKTEKDSEKELTDKKAQIKEILKNTEKDFTVLAKYISYDFAAKDGEKSLINLLDSASTADCKTFISVFASSPLEGLKYAVAYELYNDYKDKENIDTSLEWILEQNQWRLKSPYTKKNKKWNTSNNEISEGFSLKGLYNINLAMGETLNFDTNSSFNASLEFWYLIQNTTCVGFNIDRFDYEDETNTLVGMHMGFRLPFNFDSLRIYPLAKVGFNMDMKETVVTSSFYQAGLECGFDLGSFCIPAIGIAYKKTNYSIDIDELVLETDGISLYAVLSFKFE
jgi:serine protease Do